MSYPLATLSNYREGGSLEIQMDVRDVEQRLIVKHLFDEANKWSSDTNVRLRITSDSDPEQVIRLYRIEPAK